MNALIARYTHAAHVVVDGLLGISLIAYATLAALGDLVPANGEPAHVFIAVAGALLVASQALRKLSKQFEQVDPSVPAAPPISADVPPTGGS